MALVIRSRRSLLGLTALCLTGLAVSLTACAGREPTPMPVPTPPPAVEVKPAPPPEVKPPPLLKIEVDLAANANPGPDGKPRPVVVRLYELKSSGAFSGADFFSLYEKETQTLGPELVTRDEVFLTPGQSRRLQSNLDAKVRYLGVLGAFRDIDNATWRASAPITAGEDNDLRVAVSGNRIRIERR